MSDVVRLVGRGRCWLVGVRWLESACSDGHVAAEGSEWFGGGAEICERLDGEVLESVYFVS